MTRRTVIRGEVPFLHEKQIERDADMLLAEYAEIIEPVVEPPENLTGLSMGGISSISKKGHELYWIRYKPAVEGNIGRQQPAAVYVERIYD